jgi:hypothetical protein
MNIIYLYYTSILDFPHYAFIPPLRDAQRRLKYSVL